MQYIHASCWTFPEAELREIDWCSQIEEEIKQVVSVTYEHDGTVEVNLYPESTEDLKQIHALIDLTGYSGKICNLARSEFVKQYPRP